MGLSIFQEGLLTPQLPSAQNHGRNKGLTVRMAVHWEDSHQCAVVGDQPMNPIMWVMDTVLQSAAWSRRAFAVFQRLAVQAPQAEVVQGGDVFALIVPRTEDPVSFAFHL